MRRRDLVKVIGAEAKRKQVEWVVLRHGANHTIWLLGSTRIPIPRHTVIGSGLVEQILKETQAELGKGWWR
jgi:hypothetical protein